MHWWQNESWGKGFEATELHLGDWPLGSRGEVPHYGDVSEDDPVAVLEAYVDANGNFIDTARGYDDAERRIGIFLGAMDVETTFLLPRRQSQARPQAQSLPSA